MAIVHGALSDLAGRNGAVVSGPADGVRPNASAIRKSIRDDGLVSFIDGRVYQTLKRHLTAHGLHAQSYRQRYGLPEDYPMVSPSYSRRRSALAKAAGLGTIGDLTGTGGGRAAATQRASGAAGHRPLPRRHARRAPDAFRRNEAREARPSS